MNNLPMVITQQCLDLDLSVASATSYRCAATLLITIPYDDAKLSCNVLHGLKILIP